jgi:hypothetical protein
VEAFCEHDNEPSGSIKDGRGEGDFLTGSVTAGFSRRTLPHRVR